MATSVDTSSPSHLNQLQGSSTSSFAMGSSSPLLSPSSDKRFWSSLRCRIDTLLEERNSRNSAGLNTNTINSDPNISTQSNVSRSERSKILKEDSLLLLRGFDSISNTLSQLSNTLDNALQGARDLSKPPTLTEIFHSSLRSSEIEEDCSQKEENETETKKDLKRKYDHSHCSEEDASRGDSENENELIPKDNKLKKAKNIAITMATKAASLARELKSLKSNLCFVQERCALLEEENRRLRDGFTRGIRPEEDDLVRLQLEALLAEKSRLANENANLTRENQCLHQLVEYHQLTSQDLSASYEQVIQGMCLDFSSPPLSIPEEEYAEDDGDDNNHDRVPLTPRTDLFSFSTSLDENCQEH